MKPPKAIPDTLETKAIDYVASILKASRDDATNIDKLIPIMHLTTHHH